NYSSANSGLAEQFPVQPGDYLQISGKVTLILGVSQSTPPVGTSYNQLALLNNITGNSSWGTDFPVTGFSIIRGPRRVTGEDTVHTPSDVVILMNDIPTTGLPTYYSNNLPQRKIINGSTTNIFYDILFSPSGSIVGADSTAFSATPAVNPNLI